MNEKERIIELVKKNVISMEEALDLLEASANKDVNLNQKDFEKNTESTKITKEERTTSNIDINDIVGNVVNTGKDVASNLNEYFQKVMKTEDEVSQKEDHKTTEFDEESLKQEREDNVVLLKEINARLEEVAAEMFEFNEAMTINQQRLREIEIFAELDELTEEMMGQQEALEVTGAELEAKLAKLEEEKLELLRQQSALKRQSKSQHKADFKSFINESSETISETASQLGKDAKRESKKWGKFISDRSKTLIDNFNTKDVNLSFKIPWIKSVTKEYEFVYPIDNVKNIEIELYSGSIEVSSYEGNQIVIDAGVRFHGNHDEISQKYVESLLTVVNEAEEFIFKVNSPRVSMDAELKIPSREYDKMLLNLLNGDIELQDSNILNLFIKNKNGDVRLENMHINEAEFDLLNGDIEIFNSPVDTLVVKSLNGDIRVDGYLANFTADTINSDVFLTKKDNTETNIKVKTVSGDIKIAIPAELNLNIDAKTTSGSVLNRLSNLDNTDGYSSTKTAYYHRALYSDASIANVIVSSTAGNIYLKDS